MDELDDPVRGAPRPWQEILREAMARPLNYVLDDEGEPRPEPDLIAWAHWMAEPGRRVLRKTLVETRQCEVSTVFLGTDPAVMGPPILFETMLFADYLVTNRFAGTEVDYHPPLGQQWRYHTRAEALTMHRKIVKALMAGVRFEDLEGIE